MLEALRRGAQTWVAKLLFGILVVSFAIWGVQGAFRGYGVGSIAKVGGIPITAEEFNRSYQNELEQVSGGRGARKLTPEQGHKLGLDQRVLNQLIGSVAIERHANDLGLRLSNNTLVDMISNDPSFRGRDGKFSLEGFRGILRQIGMNEQGFLNLKRRDEMRNEMIGSFVRGQIVPQPMAEAIYAYNEEKRLIEYVNIDAEKAVTVAEPDEAKLRERYEAGKASYMTPEYRKFEVLVLSPEDIKKTLDITGEDIAKDYKGSKERYNIPEKRRVQQIAFKDKTAAEAARTALADGSKSFGDIAKEAGAKDTDVDLGLLTKASLIDPKVADAVFALEKDKISNVIEGRFATVLARVTQIEPAVLKTLADVKDQVRDKIAAEKAPQLVQSRHDDIEDARNAGKSLKEIADSMKLTYREVAAADRRGLAPDGKPALDGLDFRKIMEHVFSPDASSDQSSVEVSGSGYAWTNGLSTEAPKQKSFEEVKDEVKTQFMASEKKRLVEELALKLVERLNNGEAMSAVETAAGGSAQKTDAVNRKSIPQGLSEAAVTQAFALQKGKAGTAESADKQSRTVLRPLDVIPAPIAKKEDLDKVTRPLAEELANQALVEYTEALKSQFGASVNKRELNRALGLTEE